MQNSSAQNQYKIQDPRRPRRWRQSEMIRALVRENEITVDDLLQPVFVTECSAETEPIASLPGQMRYPLGALAPRIKELAQLGIKGVMLFPVNDPARKDAHGTYATDKNGLICRALQQAKQACPDILTFADIALDPFTSHGHDGILNAKGDVDNDATVAALVNMSLTLASAGCDFVCPSDMMDGRIGAIRSALDAAGHSQVAILSYCAKYASAFYGPFRDAVGQKIRGLDKSTYQLAPSNRRQALVEAELDTEEGADVLMIKPGGPYLDIVRDLRNHSNLPLAVYQVSGEYAMIKAAAERGWLDEEKIILETLLGFKRAGADMIATYFAADAAKLLTRAAN